MGYGRYKQKIFLPSNPPYSAADGPLDADLDRASRMLIAHFLLYAKRLQIFFFAQALAPRTPSQPRSIARRETGVLSHAPWGAAGAVSNRVSPASGSASPRPGRAPVRWS
jgi:hypothetical protein